MNKLIFLNTLIVLISFTYDINGQNNSFKYFPGTSEVPNNWKDIDFDDSSWPEGTGSIGYGDNDDTIETDTLTSVYLRHKLKASNLTNLKALLIYADFDDGFIAYLNGKEILRVNIDANIQPSNLTTTIRSHEAEFYRKVFRPVQGYYISDSILDRCKFDTTNIMAFEVHNDSIKGSDLSFSFSYAFYNNDFRYNYFDYKSRFLQQVPVDSTSIPILMIETDEYGFNFDNGKTATMGIINNGPGRYNKPSDKFTDYKGLITIRGRGNRSKDYPKVSFRIELIDSLGVNKNVSVFGMPEENDFVLLGPYSDESLIHNEIAFTLGRWLGYYEPRTQYCELILNGKNMGVYVFTETIKQDKSRINIKKLSKSDNSGTAASGGYIFGYDSGWEFKIFYPSEDEITEAQKKYINDFLSQLNTVMYNNNFRSEENGYRQYIDIESLADFFIVNEAVKNREAYIQSTYMYKDRDDIYNKIKYGPLWDFDNALGYAMYADVPPEQWRFEHEEVNTMHLKRILQDTGFTKLVARKWHAYRNNIFSNESILSFVNNLIDTLRPSIDRNYRIWPVKGLADYGFHSVYKGTTYDDEITKLNNWLKQRLAWIDDNIDGLNLPVVIYTGIEGNDIRSVVNCYPNPFKDHLNVEVYLKTEGSIKIEITSIDGRILKLFVYSNLNNGMHKLTLETEDISKPGYYILKVSKDNLLLMNQKLVKIR